MYTLSVTDDAVLVLMKFLQVLVECVGRYSEVLAATAIAMSTSLYICQKAICSSDLAYQKYVICVVIYNLYKFYECVETIRGVNRSKLCTNILFLRHLQKQHRQKCSQLLLTQYTTASGEMMLYPLKTYCHLSMQLEITCITEGIY